tara:strand:- start:4115 stop:4651 length:537 start_codon:yes stop_codon:yes gene_type:complete
MPFKNIIQKVTVSTSGYADHDTLFDMVEIQLPAKDCILHGGFFVGNRASTIRLNGDKAAIHFFQNNTHQPGAANEVFGLTADQIKANGYIGGIQISQTHVSTAVMGIDGATVLQQLTHLGNEDFPNPGHENPPLSDFVLTSTRIGNTVFMVGTIDLITSGNTGFDATDDMRVILSVEY